MVSVAHSKGKLTCGISLSCASLSLKRKAFPFTVLNFNLQVSTVQDLRQRAIFGQAQEGQALSVSSVPWGGSPDHVQSLCVEGVPQSCAGPPQRARALFPARLCALIQSWPTCDFSHAQMLGDIPCPATPAGSSEPLVPLCPPSQPPACSLLMGTPVELSVCLQVHASVSGVGFVPLTFYKGSQSLCRADTHGSGTG